MIGLLFTGGTISMRVDPTTGAAVPAMGSADIVALVPELGRVAALEFEDFSRLPGPHVTPDQMWRLARRAAAWLERPDIDGLVITHGTDTIEETAYLLDLVLTSEKPVVLVGAMRTVSDPSWDGPGNLVAATRVAACEDARGHGVLVVMDGQVMAAREVLKMHTETSASFASPEFGPLGVVDAGRVLIKRSPLDRPTFQDQSGAEAGVRVRRIETHVELLAAYTGITDRALRRMVDDGAKGVAIAAFGRGNVPPSLVPGVAAATAAGRLVTISSRSPAGRVNARYGYDGGALQLEKSGAVLAGGLSAAKARLLQMVALGFSSNLDEAREIVRAEAVR